MKKIRVSCSAELKFCKKPDSKQTATINRVLPNNIMTVDDINAKTFAKMVGEHGVPFCLSTFTNGGRKSNNFEQCHMMALDFDNSDPKKTISHQEALARCKKYRVPCWFSYHTMSSSGAHEKFRMIFLNDVSITSKRCAEVEINALHTLFPEADSSCRDVSRIFYGGKKLLHFDSELPEVNALSVLSGMTRYLEDKYGPTNYKRVVAKFNQENHLAVNSKGMPAIVVTDALPLSQKGAESSGVCKCDKTSPNPEVTIEGFGDNLLKRYYSMTFTNNTRVSAPRSGNNLKNHLDYRASDLAKLRNTCKLFREFESGERRLHHMELFGLATSLSEIETGNRLFLDIVSAPPYSEESNKSEGYWTHNLKNYICNYKPSACNSFCPYCDSCLHGTNMLSTLKIRFGEIVELTTHATKWVSVEEAAKDFKQRLQSIINNRVPQWYVIKAQTSLGKTEMYIDLLKSTSLRILIAVPTNKLKREVVTRAEKKGIALIPSPSVHELKDEIRASTWAEIQRLYDAGISVLSYIHERAEKSHPEYEVAFEKFMEEHEVFTQCTGHAITTHRRLMSYDVSNYDLVIVDEDIIFSSIISNRSEITKSHLRKIAKKFPKGSTIELKAKKALRYMEGHNNSKSDRYFRLPAALYDPERYDELASKIGINVSAFADATHFCYHADTDQENAPSGCVSFLNNASFNEDASYVMVSATADREICEAYFGAERVDFYECKKARYMGRIRQYCARSMSRANMEESPGIISDIKHFSGYLHTITFKKYKKGELYYGNTAGCDFLKGENMDVIGTPHQPEFIYKLFAYSLPQYCDVNDKMIPGSEILRNGRSFRFTTYGDELLRSIQLYMIESELEQAVGRARLLRYDCTVNLYSNYPVDQAEFLKDQFWK